MRAFLSISPDADTCLEIEKWCRLCWPALERPVAVQNYHLTLSFLGEVSNSQLQIIEEQLDKLTVSVFALNLDEVGYWPDSAVLWLGPSSVPEEILTLAARCKRVANIAGIKVDSRRYQPHLTLVRKAKTPPAAPLLDPDFKLTVDSFQLTESLLDRRGVRYREMRNWALRTSE